MPTLNPLKFRIVQIENARQVRRFAGAMTNKLGGRYNAR
jgi:hypothetical protein